MDFTPKYTMVYKHIKRYLKIFLVLMLITIPLSHLLNLEKFFLNTMLQERLGQYYVVEMMFSHYTIISLLAMAAFLLYICAKTVKLFFSATFYPRMTYNDYAGIKHLDLPAIPNQQKVYEFMEKADNLVYKGAGRLSNDTLRKFKVDKYGKMYK